MSRPWRRVGAIGATALLVLLTLLGAAPVPSSAQTATTAQSAAHMTVRSITPFVGPDGTFTIALDTSSLPATTRLSLVIHFAITTRSRLDRTIAGEQLGSILYSTTPRSVTELGGSNAVLSLPISSKWPAPTDGTVLTESGVHPIEIIATDANGNRIDAIVTHLLRLPSIDTPTNALAVGTVVTIGATPEVDADHAPMLGEEAASNAAQMFTVIDDPTVAPALTLSAEPFVIDALRREGASLQLPSNRTDRSTLLEPYVELDAGSLVAANLGHVIDEEFVAGADSLASAFEVQPDRRIAVIDRTVTPMALDRATAIGTTSVVLRSEQIRSSLTAGESNVLTRRFTIESANGSSFAAIASDDTAAERLHGTDPILGAHDVLAELMMLHVEQPSDGRGIALALPSDVAPSTLRSLLSGLSANSGASSGSVGRPVIESVTLDDLFARTTAATNGGTAPVVRTWTSAEPNGLGTWPASFEQAEWDLDGLRSTLPDDTDTIESIHRDLLTSAARTLDDPSRTVLVAGAQSRIRTTASAITLPGTQTVTLTSSSGKLPLVLTNELPTEAHVRVRLDSPKLDFPSGTIIDLVLAPSGTTRTDIEITTRASGAFPLDITLTSANGKLPIATSRVTVRSTAISGWGLVLSIGAGLFLAVWWARHWRSSRRADLAGRTDEPSSDGSR